MTRAASSSAARRSLVALAALVALVALVATSSRAEERRLPPELRRAPFDKMSLSVGHANAGYQVRAKRLRTSPQLAILAKSRDRAYGHPALVLMLQRSAKQLAKTYPGSKLVVGDLSSEHGGPLSGHHSHQSGRDADIAFYARDAKGRPVTPTSFVAYGADGRATDGSGWVFDDERNYRLLETWAKDHRAGLAYVFVSKGLENRLLAWGRKHARDKKLFERASALFVQPENAEPHDDHFHVRIRCPAGQESVCKEAPR